MCKPTKIAPTTGSDSLVKLYLDDLQRNDSWENEKALSLDYAHVYATPGLLDALCQEFLPSQDVKACTIDIQGYEVSDEQEKVAEGQEFFDGLDKLGQAIGKISTLEKLSLHSPTTLPAVLQPLYLRAAGTVLKHTRQIVGLCCSSLTSGTVRYGSRCQGMAEFAAALHLHPGLEEVCLLTPMRDPDQDLQNALLSLPKLRVIRYGKGFQ